MRAQAAWLKRLLKNISSASCSLCRGSLEPSHAAIYAACSDALPWMYNSCQRCALPLENAQLCIACAIAPPPYERCIAALHYLPPMNYLIGDVKRDAYAPITRQLALQCASVFHRAYRRRLPDLLVPLPLHWSKQLRRGFNQCELLGRHLTQALPTIQLRCDICRRTGRAPAQRRQSKSDRKRAVADAFNCRISLDQARIAILDDVVTTGATAASMTNSLKAAGARQVDVWCIARTGWNNY